MLDQRRAPVYEALENMRNNKLVPFDVPGHKRGKGNPALGAPNLTDKIWLHGWGEQAIVNMVTNGKNNAMPAQGRLLTPEQVHVLGAYVLSLSHATKVAGN